MRQTSVAFEEACVETIKDTSEPLNIRQLRCKKCLSAVATGEAVTSDSSKVSSQLQKNHCSAALGAAIKLFSKDSLKILHLSLEGLQAAGRHNDIFFALDPQTQSSTILPI